MCVCVCVLLTFLSSNLFSFLFRHGFTSVWPTVPPQTPKILNERGEQIQSRVGPLEEGNDLILVCVVMGGIPPPQVTWSTQGKQLAGTMLDFSFVSALNNKLVIKNLSRIHQHAVYTCHASNFPKTDVTANVTIEMYCKCDLNRRLLFTRARYIWRCSQ